MSLSRSQNGFSLALAAFMLAALGASALFLRVGLASASAERDRITERALARAREALLQHAAERPIDAVVGPGYLPCPDLDDDGWAESTCGSLAGDRGQEQRLGRLPWKTLGLDDVRDGHGERLWYAVSTKHKGLLNCAASAACVDMSPLAAMGTLTVRESSGRVALDGRIAHPERGGAAAVVIAPGAAMVRIQEGQSRLQTRECAPGACDAHGRCRAEPPQATARCDPRNYLEAAEGEDNASFHDRSDAGRTGNGDGFIQGPVVRGGALVLNDRIIAITPSEIMPRVMRRVALEAAHCLDFYASRPENGGRLPLPQPACAGASYGRIPDTPFDEAAGMLPRWWRTTARDPEQLSELPTADAACRLAVAPLDDASRRVLPPGVPPHEGNTAALHGHTWWGAWKPHVLYAPAAALLPHSSTPRCEAPEDCLDLADGAGRTLASRRRIAVLVAHQPVACAPERFDCAGGACRRVIAPDRVAQEVVLALP